MKKKNTKSAILIRPAHLSDVRPMHKLLTYYAEQRELLPRSLSELYESLQKFFVAEAQKRVVGCCALYVTWDNLAEVKSLAVASEYRGQGVGRKLLQACLTQARTLGINRLFTLTLQEGFFQHLGFRKTTKHHLPHKVWTECVRCPYFPDTCVEIAMVKTLGSKPEHLGSSARETSSSLPSAVEVPSELIVPSEPLSDQKPHILLGRRR